MSPATLRVVTREARRWPSGLFDDMWQEGALRVWRSGLDGADDALVRVAARRAMIDAWRRARGREGEARREATFVPLDAPVLEDGPLRVELIPAVESVEGAVEARAALAWVDGLEPRDRDFMLSPLFGTQRECAARWGVTEARVAQRRRELVGMVA